MITKHDVHFGFHKLDIYIVLIVFLNSNEFIHSFFFYQTRFLIINHKILHVFGNDKFNKLYIFILLRKHTSHAMKFSSHVH